MTEAAIAAESIPVPASLVTLLESYRDPDSGIEVRLWRRAGDGWRLIVPESGHDAPVHGSFLHEFELPDEEHMRIELVGPATGSDRLLLRNAVDRIAQYEKEARAAAYELSERYEEINLLYSISEILGSVLSLEVASNRILEEVADVLGARRAALWVYDAARDELELRAAVGDEGLTGPIRVNDETSVTARVFRERQPVNLERGDRMPLHAASEPRPRGEEPYLSVPINFTPPDGGVKTVGVITLVGRRSDVRFSAGDLRLLTAVASQVGAALETQRLVHESLRRERLDRELELAHDLQMKLLPDVAQFEGTARVAARCVPADSVGGDFYNLFHLSDDRLGVVIGDVSSHGFSAALIMALTMSAVAIYAQESGPPADALRRLHQALIDELESTEMYLTLFYGVIDPRVGKLIYSNAGHPHSFVIREHGGVERLGATSPPLGIAPLPVYGEAECDWRSADDLLCLFTDGLSDAFSGSSGINGEQQLLREVVRVRTREPRAILDHVYGMTGTAELTIPADDKTAVLIRT